MSISAKERDELRRLVRQRFKMLRGELSARGSEMEAEVEHAVVARHSLRDEARLAAEAKIRAAVDACNEQISAALAECDYDVTGVGRGWVDPPRVFWDNTDREALRRAGRADIASKVADAKLRLERKEVETLESLARPVLESAEAQAFLTDLPNVAELVPRAQLDQLEAQLAALPPGPPDPWGNYGSGPMHG